MSLGSVGACASVDCPAFVKGRCSVVVVGSLIAEVWAVIIAVGSAAFVVGSGVFAPASHVGCSDAFDEVRCCCTSADDF